MVDYSKLVKIHDAPPITIDILSGEAIEQTVDTLLSIKKRLAEEIKKYPKSYKTPIEQYHHIEIDSYSEDDYINIYLNCYRVKTKKEVEKEKLEEKRYKLQRKKEEKIEKIKKKKKEYQIYLKIKKRLDNDNKKFKDVKNC